MNTAHGAAGTGAPPAIGQRLILVRHGETAANVAGRFLGRTDPSLTERGAAQARALAPAVVGLDDPVLVSGPARRAVETAERFGLGPATVEVAFGEVDFGHWEGLTPHEAAERDPEVFAAFERGDIDGFPGGETIVAARARVVEAIDRHRSRCLVVVTHATLIRVAVTALLGLPVARYRSLFGRPGHTSWTELERTTDGWRLLTYDSRPGEGGR